ncbi:MAG TPA: hypothetical protein VJ736_08160 [Actinomycetota bacterium]|nr:hypothetical protein [Actinomycetota bacterium]
MPRHVFPRVAPLVTAVALAATLIASGSPNAAAVSASPTTFHGTTPPLSSIAATQHPATRAQSSGTAFEAKWLRTHTIEGQEPEGGEAVRQGEVAAPTASDDVSVTRGAYGLVRSWEGSNDFDSRYSGNGNQFSGEPPDQGLCASSTLEFEIINSVIQVYTRGGKPLLAGDSFFPNSGPVGITLAQFFGNPPEFQRPDGPFSLTAFDVSCRYDPSVQRWYVSSEYLDLDPKTGDYTGTGGFYVAVSTSANPLGSWNIWDTRTTNNGTEGTPNHHCTSGFCFGDYPQLGFDANGLYVSTNEFDFFTGEFHGAQLYAFSKADLVAGRAHPTEVVFQNVRSDAVGGRAFSLQPVISQPANFVDAAGGTEYFGMTQSPFVDGNATGISLWRLTNTSSLNGSSPDLSLTETSVPTQAYTAGVDALQKPGPTPLLTCENKLWCIGIDYPDQKSPLPLDGGSARVYGAWLRRGVVYLTTVTAVAGPGGAEFSASGVRWHPIDLHDGVAWFALRPSTTSQYVQRVNQGIVDVPGENMLFPSVAMNAHGEGVTGVTLVGPDRYPSQAYIPFTTAGPTASVEIAAPGVGPNDGFTGTGDGGYDTRWGDYGAADVAPDGTVWFANEYIAQKCSFAEWRADPTCGFTRTFFANWSTRVNAYNPR